MKKAPKYENEKMEVKNLVKGEIYNYKTLCELLGQSTYGGNQRKGQLEFFERFFSYNEVGDKYKKYQILDIYETPKSGYLPVSKSIYTKYAEIILLSHLYSSKTDNGCETYLTNKQMWKLFGLGNNIFENYLQEDNRDELVKIINDRQDIVSITESEVNKQYELHTDKFYQIVRSTLESLERRSLIKYHKCTMIKSKIWHDEVLIDQYETREVTSDEVSYILEAQNEVLKELGLNDLTQVFLHKKNKEFYDMVNNILQSNIETKHIVSYWETYHIIYSSNIIPNAVEKDLIQLNRLCINHEVRKYINEKNTKRLNEDRKSCEAINELNEVFGTGEEEKVVPTDYLELGKAFDKVTMDLGIKDEELLNQAREIAENKDVFNTIIKDVFE